MKHEKALAIRTLTEAMMNAHNMGDKCLRERLNNEITAMLAPVAQVEELILGEDAGPEPTTHDQVAAAIGDNCPCCMIADAILKNGDLPYGDEQFLYSIGVTAGYDELASIMQSAAGKIDEGRKGFSGEQLRDFTVRFSDFTAAGVRVRERLVEEGIAPPLPPQVAKLNEVLSAIVARGTAQLRK